MIPFRRDFCFIGCLVVAFTLLIPSILHVGDACDCTNSSNSSLTGIKDQIDTNASVGTEDAKTITHTIMHPAHEEALRWFGVYKAASAVYISPKVASDLIQTKGTSFSLLDYLKYTPSERNQGHCGNCWAWAGTGVMEIDNAYQNGVKDRLSVQYLTSNFHGGIGANWACCGGWLEDVADFYSSKKITVPWSNTNALWKDGSRTCEAGSTSVPSNSISTNPHYNLTSMDVEFIPTQGVGKDASIANIKNVLRQGKAIWFGFFLPDNNAWNNFFSFWDSQKESSVWKPDFACGKAYNDREGGGHAVLCVGYNDTDPNNRYWIMLNSWGASSKRPNGLFLMNMNMDYDCSYPGIGNAFYWMTLNISYSNAPPGVPSIPSGPGAGRKNTDYSYSTSTTDPNGDRIKYTFDWGDGTTYVTNYFNSGKMVSATHRWDKTGNYQIKVKAVDNKVASSDWSKMQNIKISKENSPPIRPRTPIGPIRGLVGVSYFYSTVSKDTDGDRLQYLFDWGDGTKSESGPVSSGRSIVGSHNWSAPGTYQIKVIANDGNGGESGWSKSMAVKIS